MKIFKSSIAILTAATTLIAAIKSEATVILLNNPAAYSGSIVALDNFEGSVNVPGITFDGTAALGTAAAWTGGVTPSGQWGLTEAVGDEPLRATLGSDAYEVGMFFGNDDFGLTFNAMLEVFDAANNSLGSVIVAANRNDYADQFIGLRSSTAFRYVNISYQRPNAQLLSVYIDDFSFTDYVPIPEPSTAALLSVCAVGTFVLKRWRTPESARD